MHTVTLTNDRSFVAEPSVSVLDSALSAGITLEYSCKTGRCGTCKTQVLRGSSVRLRDEVSLTPEERDRGWILTCVREATGDLWLDLEDLPMLAGLRQKIVPCRIDTLSRVAPDVVAVELRLPPTNGFEFLAGQYIDVIGPGGIKRSYSIASDMARPSKLELHVRKVDSGAMSAYWFDQAESNALLRLRGPLGTFVLRECAGLDLIFLATGTGYAPVHSMLMQIATMTAAQQPASVCLYWGGRAAADLYAEPPSLGDVELHYVPVLSRAGSSWAGARGHVQDVLLAQRPDLSTAAVYACGSDAMIHAARPALISAGLHPKRFYSDAFVSSN